MYRVVVTGGGGGGGGGGVCVCVCVCDGWWGRPLQRRTRSLRSLRCRSVRLLSPVRLPSFPPSTEWFIGDGGYFLQNVNPCEYPMWFYQFTFAATTVAIVSNRIAGRTQFAAYVASTVFMLSWVYPTIVHWVWSSTPWLVHGLSGDGNADYYWVRTTPC